MPARRIRHARRVDYGPVRLHADDLTLVHETLENHDLLPASYRTGEVTDASTPAELLDVLRPDERVTELHVSASGVALDLFGQRTWLNVDADVPTGVSNDLGALLRRRRVWSTQLREWAWLPLGVLAGGLMFVAPIAAAFVFVVIGVEFAYSIRSLSRQRVLEQRNRPAILERPGVVPLLVALASAVFGSVCTLVAQALSGAGG